MPPRMGLDHASLDLITWYLSSLLRVYTSYAIAVPCSSRWLVVGCWLVGWLLAGGALLLSLPHQPCPSRWFYAECRLALLTRDIHDRLMPLGPSKQIDGKIAVYWCTIDRLHYLHQGAVDTSVPCMSLPRFNFHRHAMCTMLKQWR
jgi:hypothetical protein